MRRLVKKYKNFDFPNAHTPLEQYFLYLKEFKAVTPKLCCETIEEIFMNLSKDYLAQNISLENFSFLVERLHKDFVEENQGKGRLNKRMGELMGKISKKEGIIEEEIRNELSAIFKNIF